MKRGKSLKSSVPHSCVDYVVAALGAGAAAPTVPVNGPFTPTTGTYPQRLNAISRLAAEAPTRASAGLYSITVDAAFALNTMAFVPGVVLSAGASPTACLTADVTIVNSATRQITFLVSTPGGVATDLGTSDMVVLYVHGQDSES